MSQKNPFEIRAEMLEIARRHLEQTYLANLEFARRSWEKTLELMKVPANLTSIEDIAKFNKELSDTLTKQLPTPPSIEEIVKKASELYGFVQKQ